jgi:hypothetical protein
MTDKSARIRELCSQLIEEIGSSFIPIPRQMILATFAAYKSVPVIDDDDIHEACALAEQRDEVFFDTMFNLCGESHDAIVAEPHFYVVACDRMDAARRINPSLLNLRALPDMIAELIATKRIVRGTDGPTFELDVIDVIANLETSSIARYGSMLPN